MEIDCIQFSSTDIDINAELETINVWLMRARLNRDPGSDFARIFNEKMARGAALQSKIPDIIISIDQKKKELKKIKNAKK